MKKAKSLRKHITNQSGSSKRREQYRRAAKIVLKNLGEHANKPMSALTSRHIGDTMKPALTTPSVTIPCRKDWLKGGQKNEALTTMGCTAVNLGLRVGDLMKLRLNQLLLNEVAFRSPRSK
jgi:hypothetical protein